MVYLFYKMRERGWFIKSFLLMGFLYGLSLAHHWPNQTVMAPAYLWFLYTVQKKFTLFPLLKKFISLPALVGFVFGFIIGFVLFQEFLKSTPAEIIGITLVVIFDVIVF